MNKWEFKCPKCNSTGIVEDPGACPMCGFTFSSHELEIIEEKEFIVTTPEPEDKKYPWNTLGVS